MIKRPNFNDIKSYQQFNQYYWYRDELIQICRQLGIASNGSKIELNHNIEEYFKGNIVKQKKQKKLKGTVVELTPATGLLECGFCFNQKFRDFFSAQTGISNFKFNTDMVATAKKVKEDQNYFFTLQDLLDVYYGKKEGEKFDNSSCQWNQFIKDFCADKDSAMYTNKWKVASILWKEVRTSIQEKVYHHDLLILYQDQIKEYKKM